MINYRIQNQFHVECHKVQDSASFILIHINDVFTDLDYETIWYADNANFLVHAKSLPDVFTAANKSLEKVYNNHLVSKLILNTAKIKFMILTPQPHRQVRNPNQVLSINNIPILEVNNFRFLGVNLSHNFSWKCHIDSVRDKLRVCLLIYKARDNLNTGCLLSILHSLATTPLNYCITTWCNSNSALTSKLQGLFNRILRLIFYRHPQENINDIYKNLALKLKISINLKFIA